MKTIRRISVRFLSTLTMALLILTACNKDSITEPDQKFSLKSSVEPLFINSIVSTDIDFITESDSNSFVEMKYLGQFKKEIPGSGYGLFDYRAYVFEAKFSNGKELGIWCHSSFRSKALAREYAEKLCPRLGKLPEVQRDMLDHVVINTGDRTAFAETEGRFFVLYSKNMDKRISTNDLEETVFHESVHASLQDIYENTSEWKAAQEADGNFITKYAKSKPSLEDMPESAIFAYTMIKHPGRLSAEIEDWVNKYMPNRLAYFRTIYE